MATLAWSRQGAGPPLVLLHGLGSARAVWDPVVPGLAEHFDVLTVDLPGFGESAPAPAGTEPHPAYLAGAVASTLDELGIDRPHVAGNSLGGWVALELAHLRPVASVTLLSPAGLWRSSTPLYCRVSLRLARWLSRHAAGVLYRLVAFRGGRAAVLGQFNGRPARLTADQARRAIRDMRRATGFDAALAATLHRRYTARGDVGAPVTVAFGSRDRLLLRRQSRHLDQLPAATHVGALPGCGHVPMADDPEAVVELITRSARRAGSAEGRRHAG
jgi:pimeloyl-ACP methyl ester carboxylesterase